MVSVRDSAYVGGAAKLQQRIRTLRRNLGLPALIPEIGELLYKRTMDRFRREVTPNEVPWAPLAAATLSRKAREGYGNQQKLVRKGYMRDAIKIIRGNITDSTFVNTGAGLRIGIDDPGVAEYAKAQRRGIPGRMPAREFLGIGRLDVKAVDSFLRRKAATMGDL